MGTEFIPFCDTGGKPMREGYVIHDADHYCTDECAIKAMGKEAFDEAMSCWDDDPVGDSCDSYWSEREWKDTTSQKLKS